MALSDLIIPSRKITLHQASEEHPEVTIEIFGLTTSDFVYLVDGYRDQLAAIFLHNAKESLSNPETSGEILNTFPDFAAACIACGGKQRDAEVYLRSLPFPVGLELLSAVFELTFPEGLKKSLVKIAPTILALLKK